MTRFLGLFGIRLFCVTYTMVQDIDKAVGTMTIMCYAGSYGHAEYKARNKLINSGFVLTGNWFCHVEQV